MYSQMNSSSNPTLLYHSNVATEHDEKTHSDHVPVLHDCSSKREDMVPIGAIAGVMRNEKIERALCAIRTITERQSQEHQQTATSTSIMHDALLERLEARLVKSETECTKLQELADSWKGTYLLEKVESLILVEKEECIKFRNLVEKTRMRGTKIQNFKDSMTASGPLPNVSQALPSTDIMKSLSVTSA
jgi:hypothetical protein